MQQRILCVVCLLALMMQGCRTAAPVGRNPLTLTKQEQMLADCLSHYSQGLIYVTKDGAFSPEALKEYKAAIDTAPTAGYSYIIPRLLRFSLSDRPNMPSMTEIDRLCTEYYQNELKNEPENPLHYVTVARINFKNGNDQIAAKTLREGLKRAVDPDAIRLYCKMQGQEFYRRHEYSRTVSCFELLSNIESDQYERFHFVLGELNEALEQPEKAIQNYTIASEGESPIPEAFIQLSMIFYKNEPEKAIETMKKAVEVFPQDAKVLFFLGYIYGLLKEYDDAIDTYDRIPEVVAAKTNATLTAEFYLTYGATCEQSGDPEKAVSVFKKGIETYPDSHQMLNYLAYMWAESSKELDTALKYVQRAIALDKNNGAYIDTLGWIYYRKGQFKKAIENIRRAQALMPGDPVIMEHLGDAYMKAGSRQEAILWWKESYIADHDHESVIRKLKAHNINLRQARKEARMRKEARE